MVSSPIGETGRTGSSRPVVTGDPRGETAKSAAREVEYQGDHIERQRQCVTHPTANRYYLRIESATIIRVYSVF
jgi:hypothetical protein